MKPKISITMNNHADYIEAIVMYVDNNFQLASNRSTGG